MRKIESFLILGILGYIFIEMWQIGKLFKILIDALVPILVGVFISYLMEPLITSIERKNISRKLACVLAYALIVSLFAIVVIGIVPTLISQFREFQDFLPQIFDYVSNMDGQMEKRLMEVGSSVFSRLSSFFSSLASIGIGAGAALYLSFDFEKVTNFYYDLAPQHYRRKYRIISKELGQTIFMYCRYMLYDTLIFFIGASLVIWICGIQYPLAFGALLALTNLIPYIGPYIGMVPFAVYGFINGQGWLCIIVAFSLQFIENNLISPLLLRNMIYLHPVLGIFGMSFFGALFGIWGMIFSRLIMALLKILVTRLFLLEKKEKMVYNASEIDDKDK